MSKVIKAKVETHSSADAYCRVKLSATGIWQMTGLVSSQGGIPLKKGDSVYVDVSEGYESPFIIGRAIDDVNQFRQDIPDGGSVIFESSNDRDWTIAYVKNNILKVVNSNNVSLEINGQNVMMDATLFKFNGGNKGGLINITDLVTKLNNLENKVNTIISTYNSHTHTETDSVTSVPLAILTGTLTPTQRANIEDTTVKH